jgi:uncharacterized protein
MRTSYAIITGASKGIGKELALQLAAKGYNILAIARNEALLQQLCNTITNSHLVKANYLSVDLSGSNAAQTIYNYITSQKIEVSIVINNAGYGIAGSILLQNATEIEQMMQVNMHVPVQLNHLLIPNFLQEQQPCYIVNIASTAAYQAVPGLTAYAATKAFVQNYSRGLQYELRNTNIAVTCVSPGPTNTDFPNRAKVGIKAQQTAEKVNMTAEEVATITLNAMFTKKTEVIAGLLNKITTALVWLLPKRISEKMAGDIYGI